MRIRESTGGGGYAIVGNVTVTAKPPASLTATPSTEYANKVGYVNAVQSNGMQVATVASGGQPVTSVNTGDMTMTRATGVTGLPTVGPFDTFTVSTFVRIHVTWLNGTKSTIEDIFHSHPLEWNVDVIIPQISGAYHSATLEIEWRWTYTPYGGTPYSNSHFGTIPIN